ncbi:hypothetical protein B9Z19DRAFT_1197010 [Tuber borchii]|uniref:Uncharacterized protein n=1 Tax=Tuber borchii TaxID=42251 RepID=A0A2T6ZCS9_TUBBO|nr:hypothetical protein B9Z19DRAFT_1197010 [Tuber borchii]
MPMLEGAILSQLMGFLHNGTGTNKDFDMVLLQFEKVVHDMVISHFKIPEESVGKFIQEQIQEIHKLFGQVQAIAESYQLWGQTPNYFCKRDIAKDLIAVMENEESVHDFLNTKPYVDHWGGMGDQDFIDLARRIVIDLNAMHEHADEDNKFMALTRQERIQDLLDLLKKCRGILSVRYYFHIL